MRDHILWSLPYPMRVLVGLLIYRNTTNTLHGQGTGRHTAEEIAAFRAEIWETLAGLLAASRTKQAGGSTRSTRSKKADDEPFWALGGEEPTEADTVLFGFIVSVLICTA